MGWMFPDVKAKAQEAARLSGVSWQAWANQVLAQEAEKVMTAANHPKVPESILVERLLRWTSATGTPFTYSSSRYTEKPGGLNLRLAKPWGDGPRSVRCNPFMEDLLVNVFMARLGCTWDNESHGDFMIIADDAGAFDPWGTVDTLAKNGFGEKAPDFGSWTVVQGWRGLDDPSVADSGHTFLCVRRSGPGTDEDRILVLESINWSSHKLNGPGWWGIGSLDKFPRIPAGWDDPSKFPDVPQIKDVYSRWPECQFTKLWVDTSS